MKPGGSLANVPQKYLVILLISSSYCEYVPSGAITNVSLSVIGSLGEVPQNQIHNDKNSIYFEFIER
jgi:hypothetical protein